MPTDVPARSASGLAINGDGDRLVLEGVLDIRTMTELRASLQQWPKQRPTGRASRTLDLGKLSGLDTPGALLLCELCTQGVELTGVRAGHKALLDLVCARAPTKPGATRSISSRSSAARQARSDAR
jgi:ABC-type transporter Mla MlaB component